MPDAYIVFSDIDQSKKMTHTLSFASIHKSITTLSPTTLPQLVVLTGTNGSGKTHLLTALKQGNVRSDLVNDYSTEVRLFDSNSIIPTDTGVFDPLQDRTRRSQWFNTVRVHREVALPQLQQVAMSLGVPAESCSTLNSIRKLTLKRLEQLLPTPEAAAGAYTHLQNTIKALGANIASNSINQIGDDTWRKFAPRIQANTPESFFLSTEENFFRTKEFLWEDIDPFQQAFGRVFSRYRELIHENDRFTNYPPPEENLRQALTLEEFRQEYGEPPWEFVNSILEVSNLDFRVDHPPMHETTSYEPKLTKVSKTIDMRFQDLSSGEKVLMSFALCLYNAQETRQQKVFPKLLLLDEVDAPLHPSMVVSLLNTIQKVLIEAKGVYVILTTHSPTTVALAPEDAIYTMNPLGPSIDKVTKNYALGLLTAGVPTLSVSFDGRRQVFVESFTDAQLYEALYQRYKMDLRSDRSVVFVEVGRRSINGEEKNAGCEQVARLVTELASAGNRSVIGLLDWDGFREQGRRLFVLSGGIRDGLESLLFDPVLLAATVIRQSADFAVQCRILPKDESYVTLSGWVSSTWQPAVDALQELVLGIPSNTETIKVFYRNGMALAIRKDYLHLDDHALEEKILSRLGLLIPINRREGGLKRFVVETILQDHPSLVPLDLIETFRALLVSELH